MNTTKARKIERAFGRFFIGVALVQAAAWGYLLALWQGC